MVINEMEVPVKRLPEMGRSPVRFGQAEEETARQTADGNPRTPLAEQDRTAIR